MRKRRWKYQPLLGKGMLGEMGSEDDKHRGLCQVQVALDKEWLGGYRCLKQTENPRVCGLILNYHDYQTRVGSPRNLSWHTKRPLSGSSRPDIGLCIINKPSPASFMT